MLLTIPFFVASVTYTIYHYVITYHFILNVGVRGGETSIFFYNCCGYFCSCYLIYHVQETPITMQVHLKFVIYIVFPGSCRRRSNKEAYLLCSGTDKACKGWNRARGTRETKVRLWSSCSGSYWAYNFTLLKQAHMYVFCLFQLD